MALDQVGDTSELQLSLSLWVGGIRLPQLAPLVHLPIETKPIDLVAHDHLLQVLLVETSQHGLVGIQLVEFEQFPFQLVVMFGGSRVVDFQPVRNLYGGN